MLAPQRILSSRGLSTSQSVAAVQLSRARPSPGTTTCVISPITGARTRSNGIRCHEPEELKALSLITAIKTPYLRSGEFTVENNSLMIAVWKGTDHCIV
jgi:hypothetical protein